jgi:hypothetical protein
MDPHPITPPVEPAPMSLPARLLNIFAVPGEVFESVKTSGPKAANWIVPALISGIIGAVSVFLMLSHPDFIQKMQDQTAQAIEKQVEAGKLSRAEADQAIDQAQKVSLMVVKVAGPAGALLAGFIQVFWWALVLWFIAKLIFRVPLNFMKTAEVAGLAGMIVVLEMLITLLLVFSFSNPKASPNLAMLMRNPDPNSPLFTLLSIVNIMSFWALAVRALGLAKLTGVPFRRALLWVIGLWLTAMLLLAGLRMAVGG